MWLQRCNSLSLSLSLHHCAGYVPSPDRPSSRAAPLRFLTSRLQSTPNTRRGARAGVDSRWARFGESAPKYRELLWVPAVCHERGGAPQYSMSQAYPRNDEEGSTQDWRPVAWAHRPFHARISRLQLKVATPTVDAMPDSSHICTYRGCTVICKTIESI